MALLKEKTAVITGGSTGVGLATARRFVEEGAYVFINGRSQAELDAAVKAIGGNVTGVLGDGSNNDVHQYLAESDSQGRRDWLAALDTIEGLGPRAVVAGHKRYGRDDAPRTIDETRQYIRDFDRLDQEPPPRRNCIGRCWRFTRTGSTPTHCGSRRSRPRPEAEADHWLLAGAYRPGIHWPGWPMKSSSAWFTSSAWVQMIACGPPAMTAERAFFSNEGSLRLVAS
jgi:NADPH:quinone reductase-like Zn-dependent oxidoreductase